MSKRVRAAPLIYTVGHSTHPLDEFILMLTKHGVEHLLDVRTVPRSRRNPQFNRETLPEALKKAGIRYTHVSGLGGLRHTRKGSINTAWHNLSFRGYADYMQTPEFAENVDNVAELVKTERCALMCAEAVPWRCHRSMIADALLVRGVDVEDIMSATESKPHHLTPWAHVEGLQITYPDPALEH